MTASDRDNTAVMRRFFDAWNDAEYEVIDEVVAADDMVEQGEKVAVRYTASGTHEGKFMGIEPTGNQVEIQGFEIDRIVDGRIVESWSLFDAFGLMQQLGVVEQPGE